MTEANVLKLSLDVQNNILIPSSMIEEIEWTADQEQYKIILETPADTDIRSVGFILSDNKNTPKEYIVGELKQGEDREYIGISLLAGAVKSGTTINLGVQYNLNGTLYKTGPIPVKIKRAIQEGEGENIENLSPTFSDIAKLLNHFEKAKAIEKIGTEKWSNIFLVSNENTIIVNDNGDTVIKEGEETIAIIPKDSLKKIAYNSNSFSIPLSNNITEENSDATNGEATNGDASKPKEDPYCLLVYYKGVDYPEYGGIISVDKVALGLITESKGESGGGGTVGDEAKLNKSGRGFAGGYKAETCDGAAVGYDTESDNGFSGGSEAKSHSNNIAIGNKAYALDKEGNIVIGTEAGVLVNKKDEEGKEIEPKEIANSNVVIGEKNKIINTTESVLVGSSAGVPAPNEEGKGGDYKSGRAYRESWINDSARVVGVGTQIQAQDSHYSVLIGNKLFSELLEYPGGAEETEGQHGHIWGNIAIGDAAYAPERGCIAIGKYAVSGCLLDKEAKTGEDLSTVRTSYQKYRRANEPDSIAIGRLTKAVGHASIALGKRSMATRYNSIAIGDAAEAGPNMANYTILEKLDSKSQDGVAAIAIGYLAKAKADGAVQIGYGTNTTENSLQFRNTMIVKNGAVQCNLEGDGVTGLLPLEHGGLGAKTKLGARRRIGLYTPSKTFKIATKTFEKGTGQDIEIDISSYKFSETPKVFLNLRFAKDNTSPVLFNYYVKSVTATKVIIRVDYWDQDWDTSKKNNELAFAFDALLVGNSGLY